MAKFMPLGSFNFSQSNPDHSQQFDILHHVVTKLNEKDQQMHTSRLMYAFISQQKKFINIVQLNNIVWLAFNDTRGNTSNHRHIQS